jgi:hypothetical protein
MVTKRVVVVRTVESRVGVDDGMLVSVRHGSFSSGIELGSSVAGFVDGEE